MRITHGAERPIQQELKRLAKKNRGFPVVDSLMRLVAIPFVEIDKKWLTGNIYFAW